MCLMCPVLKYNLALIFSCKHIHTNSLTPVEEAIEWTCSDTTFSSSDIWPLLMSWVEILGKLLQLSIEARLLPTAARLYSKCN